MCGSNTIVQALQLHAAAMGAMTERYTLCFQYELGPMDRIAVENTLADAVLILPIQSFQSLSLSQMAITMPSNRSGHSLFIAQA